MPRTIRIEYPGAIYHAMCRGNNGQDIFFNDHGSRLFLATLEEACEQTGWLIHAYVLMGNHYHLLLETPEPNLVAGMKWFQGAYTQRINAMFSRRGHLYEGRYRAIPVQSGDLSNYFQAVSTYIHLNPFRAKRGGSGQNVPLESYPWSSYPAYIGKVKTVPTWLVRDRVLGSWGLPPDHPTTARGYKHRIERMMTLENHPDAERLKSVAKQIKRGWFVGAESFRVMLTDRLHGAPKSDNLRGTQRRDHDIAEAERLLAEGLKELGCSEAEILNLPSVRIEKQALAWLMKSRTSVTGVWLAERLHMGHPVNASRAIGRFRRAETTEVMDLKARMLKC